MSREKFEQIMRKKSLETQDDFMDEAKEMDKERDQLKREIAGVDEKKKRLDEIEGQPAKKEKSAETREMVKGWENFLKKHFSEKQLDLSKLEIPERTPEQEKEFTRLLLRTNKLKLFKKCEELFPSENHTGENLDKIIADSNTKDSFIWIRDAESADQEHKNKSVNMAEEEGLDIEAISDRIMHELKYFDETGDHLDKNTGTFTSSRRSGGSVLSADWHDDKFHVSSYDPDDRNGDWRVRQVVSSPPKAEK